jgi:hypothetical protein
MASRTQEIAGKKLRRKPCWKEIEEETLLEHR